MDWIEGGRAAVTLRTVETYVSYQGEGPNTSRPTLFVRFAGCNFKCPGWPCDTQHAIQPKLYRPLQTPWQAHELATHVLEFPVDNICLTGGEVFLQNREELTSFLTQLRRERPNVNIEAFTNGGLRWDDAAVALIDNFILDWKLPGSGEEYDPTTALGDNLMRLSQRDAIKFTIKDRRDYVEARRRYEAYVKGHPRQPKVYAGVVWDAMTTEELCNWMMQDKLPWYLNVQVHKYVWRPDAIGV